MSSYNIGISPESMATSTTNPQRLLASYNYPSMTVRMTLKPIFAVKRLRTNFALEDRTRVYQHVPGQVVLTGKLPLALLTLHH